MTVYNVKGQEIHVVEEGSPNRQKAILIHGWSSSSFAMSPLSRLLSQRFHCISVDLPGYGKSPRFEGRTTINRYAELVQNLIEQISEGPVVLVGHSMGGMIGITVAKNAPVLVERMVLVAPTLTGRLSQMINTLVTPVNVIERSFLGSLLVSIVERLYAGITDRVMRPISFADRSGISMEDYQHLREDARHPGQAGVRAECFFAMRDHDLSGKLGEIEIPALVIWGAEDNTVPLRDAGVLEDEWPETDLRILPKAGHWPQFESPDVTRRLVAAYLGLPQLSDALQPPVGDQTMGRIRDVTAFLAHSSLGNGLNVVQRNRLAAQLKPHVFPPYRNIVNQDDDSQEMYLVHSGSVEVWQDPDEPGSQNAQPRRVANLKPGDMTGELSMLDQGLRTADLISGPEGATVLGLSREKLLALLEDDPELGSILMWNIAIAMSSRVRFIIWQLERATQKARAEQREWEQEHTRQLRSPGQKPGPTT